MSLAQLTSLSLRTLASVLLLAACTGGGSGPSGPNSPGSMVATSGGTPQTGTVGMPVEAVPTVKVTSTSGEAMSGVAVSFTVAGGGGSVGNATVRTNSQGVASAGSWTLGPVAGANQLTATASGVSPVQFSATANAGAPASIELVSGGGQTASVLVKLSEPVVFRVLDAGGNPVAGVEVLLGGGGRPHSATATTGADGVVTSTWTLGRSEGTQLLTAWLDGTSILRSADAIGTLKPLVASSVHVSAVDVGLFKCALRAEGEVGCWGRNLSGQLGDGSSDPSELPVSLGGSPPTFTAVALGEMHGCALTGAGAPYCWGENRVGAVGVGDPNSIHPVPVPVGEGLSFARLQAARWSTCGLTSDGVVWCWGDTGGTNPSSYAEPTALVGTATPVVDFALGRELSCAILANAVTQCWAGTFRVASGWYIVESPTPFTSLAAGHAFVCGLTGDGTAYCWGNNSHGQLGDGTSVSGRSEAAPIASALKFTAISAGYRHACAITSDGVAYCWGNNEGWQLGLGEASQSTLQTSTPQLVDSPEGVSFRAVSAGGLATCAIATDDKVYCWGVEYNPFGGGNLISRPEVVPDR